MPYTLQQLAVGSYDILLDGEVIGSVVQERESGRSTGRWYAELIEGGFDAQRPAPFTDDEHAFASLGALTAWLGEAAVIRTKARC